jgi:hypothetical protein
VGSSPVGFEQYVDDVVPLANKPWGQPVCEGQDQEEEEIGPRVAGIWVSTGEAGNRLRGESIKGDGSPPQGSLTRHLHSHVSSQAYAGFPY